MFRILLIAGVATSLATRSADAQSLAAWHVGRDSLHYITAPVLIGAPAGVSEAKSRSVLGAVVGGAAGVTAGRIIGHAANVGCRLGDTNCDPQAKQRKAMVVSAALLGGVGAGVGYLVGKVWPKGEARSRVQSSMAAPPINNR